MKLVDLTMFFIFRVVIRDVVSGYLDIRILGYPSIRISKYPDTTSLITTLKIKNMVKSTNFNLT